MARAAALLSLCGIKTVACGSHDGSTGETVYQMEDSEGRLWTATARELAYTAKQAMPWFDYPYGDPGEPAVKDEKGKVVKEGRNPVRGYVGPMRDALVLPVEHLKFGGKWLALPQAACNNLTWHQYRSLQAIAQQLFREDIDDSLALLLQAQFLAHILVPRNMAILDNTGGSIRLRLHYEYRYNDEQADTMCKWWSRRLASEARRRDRKTSSVFCPCDMSSASASTLFHICFQCYQTAISYYAASYPLLFQDSGKSDPLRDALTGEVGTINTIMKYAGYSEQQQVYESWLPYVFDILNTMTKEAKEIEKMNSKIKKK